MTIDSLTTNDTAADLIMGASLDFEAAARMIDLEDWIVERLRHPECETKFNLHILRDNGEPFTCPVFCVQHSTALGPLCGPLELASDSFSTALAGRAMETSWQHALFGLNFGGAATGVLCDPRNLSERELYRLATELRALSFPKRTVFTPGAGTNASMMGWLAAPSGKHAATFTGKPECLGGVDPDLVGAMIVLELVRASLAKSGKSLKGTKVAVQGFEGMATRVVSLCHEAGAHVVGVADVSGGLLDPLGMNPHSLEEHIKREGVLLGYINAQPVSNQELLECECDVLVLAAGADQVTTANCDRIKATLIIEASAGAVRKDAEKQIAARDITVIPSLLADAGPSLAASLEISGETAKRKDPKRQAAYIRRVTSQLHKSVYAASERWELGLRETALALGVERVANAIRAYGR